MGTELSRPLPPLPDVTTSPAPPQLPWKQQNIPNTSLPPRIPPPSLPSDISTIPLSIPFQITHHIVPDIFTKCAPLLPYPPEQPTPNTSDMADTNDENNEDQLPHTPLASRITTVRIHNTPLERLILHQALLGFPPNTSLSLLRLLSGDESTTHEAVMRNKTMTFAQKLLSVNLFKLAQMLDECWAFVLMLEPSGTHGERGVQARVELWHEGKFRSVFVMGVGKVEDDLEEMQRVMEGLCRRVWVKCLGVLCRGMGWGGEVASRVVTFVSRKVAACGDFVTMDNVGRMGSSGLGPGAVAQMNEEEFGGTVGRFRERFEMWGKGKGVEQVWREWRKFKESGTGVGEGEDRSKFEREWGKVEGLQMLKAFLGGVACVCLKGEMVGGRGVAVSGAGGRRDADFVMHCEQFLKVGSQVAGQVATNCSK